jgi:phage terminase large subunit GpA-like protein
MSSKNTPQRPIDAAIRHVAGLFAPPPDLTVSEWADRYRYLSRESSPEPGKWRTDSAPYLRGMMDCVTDPRVKEVVYMCASQTGKTECMNNVLGYFMHQDPSPMLFVRPTLDTARDWSETKLAPMVRDTPVLSALIDVRSSRKAGNNKLYKKFPGGFLAIAGANAPASLAGKTVRVVICDEEDRYPASAGGREGGGGEGDPATLARTRSENYWNAVFVSGSTPTDELSKIAARYEAGDKRRYYVPCPDCGAMQPLEWPNLKFDDDRPEEAMYCCAVCGVLIPEGAKPGMLRRGEWRAEAPFAGVAGFHLSTLYSPWTPWPKMAAEFVKAKKRPTLHKVFKNTKLAEIWQEKAERVAYKELMKRREDWGAVLPAGVLFLTCGVDVQQDRVEAEVVGWGLGMENWSIAYHVFTDTQSTLKNAFAQLETLVRRPFPHASGMNFRILATCVDTGYHTQNVYAFVRKNRMHGVYAVKGGSEYSGALLNRGTRKGKRELVIYTVGTDTAKKEIYAQLRVEEPGPDYCRFPADRKEEWFRQLTVERMVEKHVGTQKRHVFQKPKGRKNEALDCRVYALAATEIVNPDLEALSAAMAETMATPAQERNAEGTPAPRRTVISLD